MKIHRFFMSNAYNQGYEYAKNNNGMLGLNPYIELAKQDNVVEGRFNAPYWDTDYQPFIDWENGSTQRLYENWIRNRKST